MVLKSKKVNCGQVFGKHLLIWATAFCLTAFGCGGGGGDGSGGGGGGGGDGGGGDDGGYTGKTTPAVITGGNASKLSDNTMEGKSRSEPFTVKAAFTSGDQSDDGHDTPYLVDVSMAVKRTVEQMDVKANTGVYKTAKAKKATKEIQGENGGSATLDMELDQDTGKFSGTMIFNDYRNEDMALKGDTSFSGIYKSDEERFESLSMQFKKVTGKSESDHVQMDGDISMEFGEENSTVSMTMEVKDLTNDQTYKFEDYRIALTEDKENNKTALEISGRFYHPDEGYVDIETTSPFVTEGTDTYPSSGVMELTGEKGETGGPTKAKLTTISNTQCQVEVDTNGDGTYDNDSGVILWDDLSDPEAVASDTNKDDPDKDDPDKDGKRMEVNVDSCFKLSTAEAKDGDCNDENDGDIYFWEGASVDLYSKEHIFCPLEGEFADLESIPSDYSDCSWVYAMDGLGVKNAGVIVRDSASTHHYKMRIVETELPSITFEYEKID